MNPPTEADRGNRMAVVDHPGFGYFTAALLAMAALAYGAAVQFLVIGARQRHDRTHLAFAVLATCLATLALGNALMNAADSVVPAIRGLRMVTGAAILAMPALMVFVGCYTGRPAKRPVLGAVCFAALGMFALNLIQPYTAFDTTLREGIPLVLPWGESLFTLDGTRSFGGDAFRWASYAIFLWALYRAWRQYREGQRLRGALLGLCLLIQFVALLWGAIVVSTLGKPYPSLDAFAFLSFVLLMGVSLAGQMHAHTLQLERTARELRAEADIRRETELDLRHAAYHDALTGLPNRLRALYTLADLIADATQSQQHGAVLMIDLDNFKTINDSLGHHVGDRVLESIADSLLSVAPAASTVARLGGDEFVVLLGPASTSADDAAARAMDVAAGMLQRLAAPLAIDNRVLGVGASIGVALFPEHGQGAADVVRCADIALYRAKSTGRNAARLFLPHMQRDADERLELERGLRTALEQQDFSLHFQPQVDMHGALVGAEALLRWNHARLGQVSPAIFIPIAEETGLIHAIGTWAIECACRHIRQWREQDIDFGGRISINISPWQIAHPQFVSNLAEQVAAAGIEPSTLTLELTESALLGDFDAALRTLQQLSAIGFRLALDDFGTGYSSLAYLQQLPLDELKIDRSFIGALQATIADPLASFVIDVGRRLGMTTIAEGVETAEQEAVLRELGCDLMQGYFICRPLAADDFRQWVGQRAAAPAVDAVPAGA
ncbi:EAL domain-containing protein [Rhodanobacter sp. Root561]|uniref:putative bifunctional diguanylate cyclase/phosphodiesterase n=1 Tax=Rhodanobacter sp. Root561 TaxID=1736560 RepID=UPI001F1FB581|nr:EAL domain-containing protein [Rhodanobacter sp. Root561]